MSQAARDTSEWFDLVSSVERPRSQHESRDRAAQLYPSLSRRLVRFLLALVILTGVLKASLLEAFFVPSSSMTPTLRENDYILVPKFLYGLQLPLVREAVVTWAHPSRGDVVVFKRSGGKGGNHSDEAFVKRVIALEGDLIEIVGNRVLVNGAPLVEPYATWSRSVGEGYHFGPARVPHGSVFVLGDNRENSDDSRFWDEPFVSLSHVVGRAVMVYWSAGQNNRAGIVL